MWGEIQVKAQKTGTSPRSGASSYTCRASRENITGCVKHIFVGHIFHMHRARRRAKENTGPWVSSTGCTKRSIPGQNIPRQQCMHTITKHTLVSNMRLYERGDMDVKRNTKHDSHHTHPRTCIVHTPSASLMHAGRPPRLCLCISCRGNSRSIDVGVFFFRRGAAIFFSFGAPLRAGLFVVNIQKDQYGPTTL